MDRKGLFSHHLIGVLSIVVMISLLLLTQSCDCIRFMLQPHTTKCLQQEMYINQLAVGDYEIMELPGTQVDMTITDSTNGHIALRRENIEGKGKFALTSDDADLYEICFSYLSVLTQPGANYAPREIFLDYRVGAEAKGEMGFELNATLVDKLDQNLDRIDYIAEAIIDEYARLKKRAQEMHDTNESTNNRMFYQAVTSVIVILALATWQVLYLRSYFKIKKLID